AEHPRELPVEVAGRVPQPTGPPPGLKLVADLLPGRGEARVVDAQRQPVAAAEQRVERARDRRFVLAGTAHQGHLLAGLLDVEVAVAGGADQPPPLLVLPDRLGEHDATLGWRQLRRRAELGGGQRAQLLSIDAIHHSRASPAVAAPPA